MILNKSYYKSTKPKSKYWLFIIVVFSVLTSDTLFFMLNENGIYKTIQEFAIIIISFVLLIKYLLNKHLMISRKFIIYAILPIISIILTMIINVDISGGYLVKIGLIIFSFIITQNINLKIFSDIYIKLMSIISIYSLIVFAFSDLIVKYSGSLPTVAGNYVYLVLSSVPYNTYARVRNWGPFWEPGVYQAYLVIAIIFLLFQKEKKRKLHLSVIVIALLTTLSTTGYVALILVIMAFLFNRSEKFTIKKIGIVIILCILIIVLLLYSDFVFSRVFDKLINAKDDRSFNLRWQGLVYNIKIFLSYPIFGAGIKSREIIYSTMALSNGFVGMPDSNTSFQQYAVFGFSFGTFFIWLQWKFANVLGSGIITKLLLFIVFMILMNTETLMFSIFFNLIFYWGIRNPKNDKQK